MSMIMRVYDDSKQAYTNNVFAVVEFSETISSYLNKFQALNKWARSHFGPYDFCMEKDASQFVTFFRDPKGKVVDCLFSESCEWCNLQANETQKKIRDMRVKTLPKIKNIFDADRGDQVTLFLTEKWFWFNFVSGDGKEIYATQEMRLRKHQEGEREQNDADEENEESSERPMMQLVMYDADGEINDIPEILISKSGTKL